MSTKSEILHLADRLIRQRGYNAFSYSDISEHVHIRPAAVHYYFPTKSDLGLEVIRQELRRIAVFRRQGWNLSGKEQLKRLFHTFYRQCVERWLCLMGSLTPDFATFEPALQDKVKELCSEILGWIAECLEQERREGRMRFEGTAGDRALMVVSTLLSSLLLQRVIQDQQVFERMADQLLRDLGADWQLEDLPLEDTDFDDPNSYT
jgi:TetR/AcrR family transcriptional regulator, transcriptional repressor for nem operon